MSDHAKLVEDKMGVLRAQYTARLSGQINDLEHTWTLLEADPADGEAFDALSSVIHRVAGSGAFFGYRELSDVARDLEKILLEAAEAAEPLHSKHPLWILMAERFEVFLRVGAQTLGNSG